MSMLSNRGRPPYEGLTPAEERVLEHIRLRRPNAEIAVRLGISTSAVKYHVSNMLAKAGVQSREELLGWRPGPIVEAPKASSAAAPLLFRLALGVTGLAAVAGIALGALAALPEGSSEEAFTGIISVGFDGSPADGDSGPPSVSADGRYIVFHSEATNLVPGDANGVSDVFLYDANAREIRRLSVATDGSEADGPSWQPRISGDGDVVVFESEATNLVPGGVHIEPDQQVLARWWASVRADTIAIGGEAPDAETNLSGYAPFFFGPQMYGLDLDSGEVEVVSSGFDGSPVTCVPRAALSPQMAGL
jgi:DNA-binding CsgD family transcriptional regulator